MSRVYDVDFMTEDDLLTIFRSDELSHKPKEEELEGVWGGMLVSDSAITRDPNSFTLTMKKMGIWICATRWPICCKVDLMSE
jgi:hypothetical protein